MELATNLRNDFENELYERNEDKDTEGSEFVYGKTFATVKDFLEAVPKNKQDERDPDKGVSI